MALATIRPKTAGTNIVIGGVEYNNVMNFASVRADAPLLNEVVFSNEAQGGESSIGTQILTITLGGILKRGASNSGPLIPLPENQAFNIEFDDGCKIEGTCNFVSASGGRTANGIGAIDGTAISTSLFTKTWNQSS